jgi:hypothetical protein
MDPTRFPMRSTYLTSDGPAEETSTALAHGAAFGLVTVVLLALLLGLAGAGTAPGTPPEPLAAPSPAIVTGIDFPEQAQPWGACTAILEHSSAIGNNRSERADELTGILFQDACFGA